MYRLLVSGAREFDDFQLMCRLLDGKYSEHEGLIIVHGDCPTGADRLAKVWAEWRWVKHEPYPASWNKYGKPAGFIRNQEMIDTRPDEAWFFPKGISSGTWDCFTRAKKAGIPYVVFGEFEQQS